MGEICALGRGGRFAEVLDDATVALPLIVGAVLERIGYLKPDRKSSSVESKPSVSKRKPAGKK